ncbi:helicase-associated domain-containing protein [Motilibacter aurantiacus]|uniref:helicase-associated domain-containing protein n=1 Tax=Motilibacter aurantiacus TaxID=2714955 RepID=UPI00140CB049|nr:helicase-associated domain-containing protein [Motilibacter aurantiacus]NHC46887.1 DNA-binding protein [Motilibacter aurantiacus]
MRSLADDLRARDDAALAELLRTRPDLLGPVPPDLGALGARAAGGPSVARALDRLDLATLQVVDVLCTLPEPTDEAAVSARWGADAAAPLATLRTQALVWGADGEERLVRGVRDLVREPAGLGPPVVSLLTSVAPSAVARIAAAYDIRSSGDPVTDATAVAEKLADATALDALLATAPPGAREALGRLAWGPPTGAVPDARRDIEVESARTPVEWLLAHGLLVPASAGTAVLPLEVGLHLRGGHVHREPAPVPPPLATVDRGAESVARAAGQSAFDAVRRVEELLEAWSLDGPPVLRGGGLGVRELRRAAGLLDVEEPVLALLVETAYAAGLLGPSGDLDELWVPTPAYDAWLELPVARRWATLAGAWLATTRVAGLVGSRDDRDRPLNALGGDLDRPVAPELRSAALTALAEAPAGAAVSEESLFERVTWHRPRRGGRFRDELLRWALAEAETLGVTGRGAIGPGGRALLGGDEDAAGEAVEPYLPEPVEELLLQADLTAVAPGPLVPELAREVALAADVESTGGATVYRFTPASVRRALDAGRSADDLHSLLARHSRTPVPQPLSYLVDDVARRHGLVRVGTASAYVRCDDPAVLSEVLADRRAGQLRLRRLAPTVLASQAPVDVVLERLRAMGLAPAAESPEGEVVVRRPDARRTPPRPRPPRLVFEPPAASPATLAAAVRALRAGDRAATAVRRSVQLPAASGLPPRSPVAEVVAALRRAAVEGFPVVIGYVNAEGTPTERVIEPMSVEGGYVSAFDHLRDEVRTFAISRIMGIAAVADEPA